VLTIFVINKLSASVFHYTMLVSICYVLHIILYCTCLELVVKWSNCGTGICGICEEVLSSCNASYEVPYSSSALDDRGQLMVTNFRITFVPYQPTDTEPVSCLVCS